MGDAHFSRRDVDRSGRISSRQEQCLTCVQHRDFGGLQAQLRGTYRCDVPSRARADNYQIKCVCQVRTIYKMWISVLTTRTRGTVQFQGWLLIAYSSYESARAK